MNEISYQPVVSGKNQASEPESHESKKQCSYYTVCQHPASPGKVTSRFKSPQTTGLHEIQKQTSSFRIKRKPDAAFEARCGQWAANVTRLMAQVNQLTSSTYYKFIHAVCNRDSVIWEDSPPLSRIPACSQWAATVIRLMAQVNQLTSSTHYEFIHAEYDHDPVIWKDDSLLSRIPAGRCPRCKDNTDSTNPQLSDTTANYGQYNPNRCFSWKQKEKTGKTISKQRIGTVGKPTETEKVQSFQSADLIIASKNNKAGNCGEKAHYFAVLYAQTYPDHQVSILALKESDHMLVKVHGESIGNVIIDPWTHQYFSADKSAIFLHNPTGCDYDIGQNQDIISQVVAAMPDNLPKAFQPIHESLLKIEGLNNKVKHLKQEYSDLYIGEGYLSQKGNKKRILGYHRVVHMRQPGNLSMFAFAITEYGLHLLKP